MKKGKLSCLYRVYKRLWIFQRNYVFPILQNKTLKLSLSTNFKVHVLSGSVNVFLLICVAYIKILNYIDKGEYWQVSAESIF